MQAFWMRLISSAGIDHALGSKLCRLSHPFADEPITISSVSLANVDFPDSVFMAQRVRFNFSNGSDSIDSLLEFAIRWSMNRDNSEER